MTRRSFLFVALFLLLSANSWAELRFGPYLQSMTADTTQICAFVEPNDTVVVSLLDAEKEVKATGHAPACANLTGLAPNVEHRYEMKVNGKVVTPEEPPSFLASSDVDLTFVIYGDTRSGDESYDLYHRQVVQAIREAAVPDAILHTGDFVERGEDLNLWTNFFHIETPLLRSAPIFPAIGRSDQPPELMQQIFPLLSESPWYSFDRGDAHFAVMKLWKADQQEKEEISASGPQADWLRDDLSKAKERGAKYIFVLMHQPPVDVTGKPTSAARDVFMPLFSAFDVTAVFSGAHYFSHFEKDGVHYFTNGGGGAVLEAQEPKDGVFRFYSAVHHFLILECGRSGVRLRAVNTHGSDFYQVRFDQEETGTHQDQEASNYALSYFGGDATVPLTVFFNPGCSDCEFLKEEFPDIAVRTEATLMVTFRSLGNPDNQALLKTVTNLTGPTPIVTIGDTLFTGLDQVHKGLDKAIVEKVRNQPKQSTPIGRIAIVIGVLVAGLVVVVSLVAMRKKKR